MTRPQKLARAPKRKRELTIRDLVTMMHAAGWEVHFRLEPMKPVIDASPLPSAPATRRKKGRGR